MGKLKSGFEDYITEGKTWFSTKMFFVLKMSRNCKNINTLKIRR
jgi:hypothetical protein